MPQISEGLDCLKIISGERDMLTKIHLQNLKERIKRMPLSEKYFLNVTKDCNSYRSRRKFISYSMSKEEEEFPIAYSMVIDEKIEMFERLLRSIYAPQNIYCVHVDSESPVPFQQAVRGIASCFSNVFLASKLEKVVYASWSRVQADLNCMKDLLGSNVQWEYLLNTCETDFPLKTNAEIVKALKILKGKNSLESVKTPADKMSRWLFHHEIGKTVIRTNIQKTLPPVDVPIFSGGPYFVVTREFVKHILRDSLIDKFFTWEQDTYSPDEHLWATLNRMPGVPGSMPHHEKYDVSDLHSIARVVKFSFHEGDVSKGASYPHCTGSHQYFICIYGCGDLQWLVKQHHLFASKFDPSVDDMAIQCLEEYLRNNTLYKTET
ncbi:beta-1,3-galactosyl-O-glycosyl-glycoprotein beta-1,6-N-acetylglucosaminyltransferase 3-like [Hyperolius riggenbachi]|uniref:beta-1,3-galactosyl-O-glycosyl-glycoprotein beta-1,6-N-acetylglucosaminyltransferase 3-like n=1 Tax=Hyperolius riggenbachi TaxID=752182 RepID=UPI0035A346B2